MDVMDLVASLRLDSTGFSSGLKAVGGGIAKFGAMSAKALGVAAAGVSALVAQSVDAYANYEQLVGGVQKLYGNMGMSLEDYAEAQKKTIDEVKDEWKGLEEAQNLVAKNASEAWKTAGMSANDYMEKATGFSAALIKSVGGDTVKAAEMTDVAMRAMSDNVNTFGTDMESVSNAFMGFAKSNFSMLDNLKLGYSGSTEGMKQLVADANEYAKSIGKAGDLSMDSFADIVQAIELIQEKTNIAGTTSREAMSTIEGSLSAVKASWENVVSAIAGGGDLAGAFAGLEEGIFGVIGESGDKEGGLLNNVIPRIQTALDGIGDFIQTAAPEIAQKIPPILDDLLPGLTDAATSLISGFADTVTGILSDGSVVSKIIGAVTETFNTLVSSLSTTLPSIVDAISGNLPTVIEGLGEAARTVIDSLPTIIESAAGLIADNLPVLLDEIFNVIEDLADKSDDIIAPVLEVIPSLISKVITSITDSLPGILDTLLIELPSLIDSVIDTVIELFENAPELLTGITDTLTSVATIIADNIPVLIETITARIPEFVKGFTTALTSVATIVADNLPILVGIITEKLPELLPPIIDAVMESLPALIEANVALFTALVEALPQCMMIIAESLPDLIESLVPSIIGSIPILLSAVVQIFTAIGELIVIQWMSIVKIWQTFIPKITEFFGLVGEKISEWFGNVKAMIPEKIAEIQGFISKFLSELPYNIGLFLGAVLTKIIECIADVKSFITTNVPLIIESIHTFFEELPSKLKELFDKIVDNIAQWATDFKNKASTEIPRIIDKITSFFEDLPKNMKTIGTDLIHGLWDGISNASSWLKEKIGGFASGVIEGFQKGFDIGSPSKKARDLVGKFVALGVGEGIEENVPLGSIDSMINSLFKEADKKVNMFDDIAIGTGLNTMGSQIGGIAQNKSVAVNNVITVNGAADPELWAQGFIRTINRQERMLYG